MLTVLEKQRPVVVLADSGGAAKDIHDFCTQGRLPTNTLRPDDKGYTLRQQHVDTCKEKLPLIAKLGQRQHNLGEKRGRPLLCSFVQAAAVGRSDHARTSASQVPPLMGPHPSRWGPMPPN